MAFIHKLRDLMDKMYKKVLDYAVSPYSIWVLAGISFVESSFFPIPPDVLLIPMILAKPEKAFRYAAVCTIASVFGAYLGYAIGMFLYDIVVVPLFNFYGYMDKLDWFKQAYNEQGAMIVLFAGFTPFPYKVITITSGITGLDLTVFSITSVIAREARFYLVAALLWKFGTPIKVFIEKNLGWLSLVFFVCLFLGFYLVKYIG